MNINDCKQIFGASNVKKVVTLKINGGKVDFGDEPHLGGAPHGTAVVCWLTRGRVAVLGKLYCDVFEKRDSAIARIEVRFRRESGQSTGQITKRKSVENNQYWVASRSVALGTNTGDGDFDEVRIRLSFEMQDGDLGGSHVVESRTFNRP